MSIYSDIGPFAIVPLWVLEAKISPTAKVLYALLSQLANSQTGTSHPSIRHLEELLGCSRSTVQRARTELVEIGALEVVARTRDDGGQGANEYHIKTVQPGRGPDPSRGQVAQVVPDEPEPAAGSPESNGYRDGDLPPHVNRDIPKELYLDRTKTLREPCAAGEPPRRRRSGRPTGLRTVLAEAIPGLDDRPDGPAPSDAQMLVGYYADQFSRSHYGRRPSSAWLKQLGAHARRLRAEGVEVEDLKAAIHALCRYHKPPTALEAMVIEYWASKQGAPK